MCLRDLKWDRFVVDKILMGRVCGCHCGNGKDLWLTKWKWDRFVVDRVAMGKICG